MTVSEAWECLRGDPLPWLLDEHRPNLHWKVLTDLFRRSSSSPAVVRARGGADAVDPVASLVSDFDVAGELSPELTLWKAYSGIGWRLIAAVQWGADPTDPRLQTVAGQLVEVDQGGGGVGRCRGGAPDPLRTARLLHALGELGWGRHPWFQESLAWLEDGARPAAEGGWRAAGRALRECPVTPVAVLGALVSSGEQRRTRLLERAQSSLDRTLARLSVGAVRLGHPCLGRTDLAEVLSIAARIGAPLSPIGRKALARLQSCQIDGGRWRRQIQVSKTLPCGRRRPAVGPSRWVTLKCVTALMHYGIEADLPRMFPAKPDRKKIRN